MPKTQFRAYLDREFIELESVRRGWDKTELELRAEIDRKTLTPHLDKNNPTPATVATIKKLANAFGGIKPSRLIRPDDIHADADRPKIAIIVDAGWEPKPVRIRIVVETTPDVPANIAVAKQIKKLISLYATTEDWNVELVEYGGGSVFIVVAISIADATSLFIQFGHGQLALNKHYMGSYGDPDYCFVVVDSLTFLPYSAVDEHAQTIDDETNFWQASMRDYLDYLIEEYSLRVDAKVDPDGSITFRLSDHTSVPNVLV